MQAATQFDQGVAFSVRILCAFSALVVVSGHVSLQFAHIFFRGAECTCAHVILFEKLGLLLNLFVFIGNLDENLHGKMKTKKQTI